MRAVGKGRIYLKKLVNFIFICITVLLVIAHIINIFLPLEYEDIVEKYAKEYSVSKSLVLGIIKTESNFDKEAVSSKGAKGLMQITDSTAEVSKKFFLLS